MNKLSPQLREAKMYNEAQCTWPTCACMVPYYAFSGHNRVDYCDRLKILEITEAFFAAPYDPDAPLTPLLQRMQSSGGPGEKAE